MSRYLSLTAAGLAVVLAVFGIWRTRQEAPSPTRADPVAPAALPAHTVSPTAQPPAPPERKPTSAERKPTPVTVEPEASATNEARFKALHQAIMTTTPEAARLYSDLAKAGVATPPEARTLVQMRENGASRDALVAYVRTSFPNEMIVRAVALRWLDAGSHPPARLDTNPASALGGLVKRDAK